MDLKELCDKIQDADMILVGLGEEFNDSSSLKKIAGYQEGKNKLQETGSLWMLPAYDMENRKRLPDRMQELELALRRLEELMQGKNYFIVSVALNDMIEDIPWKDKRLVRPCGGAYRKQCVDCCSEGLQEVTEKDQAALAEYVVHLQEWAKTMQGTDLGITEIRLPDIGTCSACGKPLVLNNVYAEHYDENGYLPQWQLYTKWLQGTLNKKVLILELGVGMKYPSVIRWPFEKIAFFNKKASFYRINENLYQLSEEIKEKGVSIAKNSVDWLLGMC